jgi:L-aspartate oxidase
MKTDVLVIGSGIAGLSFAIKVATAKPEFSILVLSKSNNDVCNTAQAQGGIAVVLDRVRDSFDQHIEDTLKAGKYLNDPEVVKMVVSQAPARLKELMDWGSSFDCNELGELDLGLEGGHSQKRIVHHRDLTGKEMEIKLLQKAATFPNISIYDHYFVTDLLIYPEGKKCTGVKVLNKRTKQPINICSRITFLATGGSGRIFKKTTNPFVATADGVAMAHRAGAKISNMDFIQFHPTALFTKNEHALFLISEAVRGFGAHVVDHNGNRFLFKYDLQGELATRDIVSEAIVKELKNSGRESVFLDCRHLDHEKFREHFPTIVNHCGLLGFKFTKDLIPVVPAAHYQCGGIEVDKFAATSIENLFASGECTHTGLHGANRLASNSLLEALVYSHQAAGKVVGELELIVFKDLPQEEVKPDEAGDVNEVILGRMRQELNKIMDFDLLYASHITDKEEALRDLQALEMELKISNAGNPEHFELKNMVQTAQIILEHAMCRTIFRQKL